MELNKKLDEILGVRVKVIKENVKPSSGIWYYVWLKPKWERIVVKATEYGQYGHDKFWEAYIAPKLVKHYKLKSSDLNVVKEWCYSMPRGRVERIPVDSQILMGGEKPGMWYMDYGGDIPSQLDSAAEQKKLVSDFDLTGFANNKMVRFRTASHEKMSNHHKSMIQKLIGVVPY